VELKLADIARLFGRRWIARPLRHAFEISGFLGPRLALGSRTFTVRGCGTGFLGRA